MDLLWYVLKVTPPSPPRLLGSPCSLYHFYYLAEKFGQVYAYECVYTCIYSESWTTGLPILKELLKGTFYLTSFEREMMHPSF